MASVDVNSKASCAEKVLADEEYSAVSKHKDREEKTLLKAMNMPNGCVKHVCGENGRVVPIENGQNDSRTRDGNVMFLPNESHIGPNVNTESVIETELFPLKISGIKPDGQTSPDPLEKSEPVGSTSHQSVPVDMTINIDRLKISEGSLEAASSGECSAVPRETGSTERVGVLEYIVYNSEHQMPDIMRLITKDLSEPYSIYTYRYFIHNWPRLCFLAVDSGKCVGAIVCKHDLHKKMVRRGYIAMLAVDQNYRRRGIGSHLVMKAIRAMVADECDEVVLETEITNKAALRLYENLGFLRDKRLFRYYLNGVDALRLKLWLR